MRKTSVSLSVQKPRNGVVRALVEKLRLGSGRHSHAQLKRLKATDDFDLAQRVREVGEW